jgi:hypothetical protein
MATHKWIHHLHFCSSKYWNTVPHSNFCSLHLRSSSFFIIYVLLRSAIKKKKSSHHHWPCKVTTPEKVTHWMVVLTNQSFTSITNNHITEHFSNKPHRSIPENQNWVYYHLHFPSSMHKRSQKLQNQLTNEEDKYERNQSEEKPWSWPVVI